MNPPFSNPSKVAWVDGALHSGTSKPKEKVEQHACLFQDYKNNRSSSEWSLFEPRVFLYTETRRVRFTEYGLSPVYTGDFCRRISMHFLLQLQNCTCKSGEIFSAICRRDIAGAKGARQKLHRVCRDKNRLCTRAFRSRLCLREIYSEVVFTVWDFLFLKCITNTAYITRLYDNFSYRIFRQVV